MNRTNLIATPPINSLWLDTFVRGMTSSVDQPKITAMTENGAMPDPDRLIADGAYWSWFMTWNDGLGAEGVSDSSSFWTGEYYNENSHKDHVVHHDDVLTRDELPDLETYPLE